MGNRSTKQSELPVIWFVGVTIEQDDVELGWMPEGVYATEDEAVEAAGEYEFVLMARVGERLPAKAEDAERLYFPKQETWEESALYQIQQERNKHELRTTQTTNRR